MTVRLTEATLRRIVREETEKLKGKRRLNESQAAASEALEAAIGEYVDQMTMAGIGDPDVICRMLQDEVSAWCEEFLAEIEDIEDPDRDRGPSAWPGG